MLLDLDPGCFENFSASDGEQIEFPSPSALGVDETVVDSSDAQRILDEIQACTRTGPDGGAVLYFRPTSFQARALVERLYNSIRHVESNYLDDVMGQQPRSIEDCRTSSERPFPQAQLTLCKYPDSLHCI